MARWTDDPPEPVGTDIEEARTLPASAYTDQAVFETEQARIFADSWQYLGDASGLREPGDYTTHEIAGRPLFVIRISRRKPTALAVGGSRHAGDQTSGQRQGDSPRLPQYL